MFSLSVDKSFNLKLERIDDHQWLVTGGRRSWM